MGKKERLRLQIAEKRKDELKKLELLEKYAVEWDKAQQIRRFVDSVELELAKIQDGEHPPFTQVF